MSSRHRIHPAVMWLVVLAVVALVSLALFGGQPGRDSAKPSAGWRSIDSTLTAPGYVEPGIKNVEDGRVQASGTVAYVDIESGFWALTKPIQDPASSQGVEVVVVVVVNAEQVGLPEFEGQDVAVNGTLIEGASIRMSGPEMNAEAIILPH